MILTRARFKPGNLNVGVNSNTTNPAALHQLNSQLSHLFTGMTVGLIIGIFVVIFLIIIAISLLIVWLGSRGQFMFLDNIVRNRGAIAWPWQNYSRQGNSFFLSYLLFGVGFFLLIVPILVGAIILCIPLFQQHRWPSGGEIGIFAALFALYLIVGITGNIVLFLFREFGIPIMFRQGLPARAAFMETMNLIRLHPGSICVFLLLRIAIFIGTAFLCVIICCATCCIGALPYIGTVLLLPVLVFVRCFTLDCLAQFGPDYDVFTVDVPPASAAGIYPPINRQRPPG